MPNTKQFEAVDINDLIFGNGKSYWLSMVEISEEYFSHIKEAYKLLVEGKIVTMEVPSEEAFYYLKKKSSDLFLLDKLGKDAETDIKLTAIETVNWLFAKAPFISIVGYSNI